ncbi:MAG: ISAs1 family transposase [Ruminococcus sp.]|nr:ISAs1 family transposase [Ruminococcus sp.]
MNIICLHISWFEQKQEWSGLSALGMVRSTVTEGDETRVFTRYFITSLIDLNEFSYAARKYWSIENQIHWCLDVIFREDASGARKDNSPLNVMRKTALSLVTQAQYGCINKKKIDV